MTIPEGEERNVFSGEIIDENYGTVTINRGTIRINYGTVKTNEGSGTVEKNRGTIGTNGGRVDRNSTDGIINYNTRNVGTNDGTIDVVDKFGSVETNERSGIINRFEGEMGTNRGTIKYNTGRVNQNIGTINLWCSVSANDAAKGTVTGEGSYAPDTSVTLTATANSGYKFVCWEENGVEVSTDAAYTFPANTENGYVRTFTAVFGEQKKISVRTQTVGGNAVDTVTGGTQTDFGATHTITVTPKSGYRLITGYFAGTDYNGDHPSHYNYQSMTLEKLSTDASTGAVTYQFTATECIPIEDDATYDYICLFFYCAKAPQKIWPSFITPSGSATAPSPDGTVAAVSYESQYELCTDPNKTGYYQLNNAKDRPYLGWEVSITDKTTGAALSESVTFDGNKLHYTPTVAAAGKTVCIQVRPRLGDELKAAEPLIFEIKVNYPEAAKIRDVSETLNDVRQPEALAAVQDTVKSGDHYTAALSWSPEEASGKYGFETVYTATLTLTPEPGYSLHSIAYPGWKWGKGTPDGGAVISKEFPATRKEKITSIDPIGSMMLNAHTDKDGVIAQLPAAVNAVTETGQTSLTLNWSCENFDPAPNVVNTFLWTADCDERFDTSNVTLNGSITVTNPGALPVSITGTDREVTYDGNPIDVSTLFTMDGNAGTASYRITGDGTLDGSALTVTRAGTFTVTVSTAAHGIYAAGGASAILTVNPKTLTPRLEGTTEKTYDGTADAPAGLSIKLDGLVEGDDVTASAAYSYDGFNVGNRTITATGIALDGTAAGCYILSSTTATAAGTILQAGLIITAKDQEMTYGGSIAAGTDQVTAQGLVSGDALESITLTADATDVPGGTITPSGASIVHGETARLRGNTTDNYVITYRPGKLTINRKPIPVPAAKSGLVYDGSEQTGVEQGEGYTLTGTCAAMSAGSYTASAVLDGNHIWEDGSTEAKTLSWSIAPARMTGVQVSGYSGTYDGFSHGIAVTVPQGAAVKFGTTADGCTQDSVTFTDAGTYTVYYRVTRPNYEPAAGSASVIIDRKPIPVPTAKSGLVYNGQMQTGVEQGEGYTLTGVSTAADAGSYTAIAALDGNHIWEDGSTEAKTLAWSIAPARMTGVQASGYSGTYDGKAHGITVTGYPSGVTVMYGTADGTYDRPESPAYKNAGSYTVYYRLTNPNYQTVTGSADVIIRRKELTVSITADGGVYSGNPFPAAVKLEGVAEDDTVSINLTYTKAGEAAGSVTAPADAGTYTVTASIQDGNYHLTGQTSRTFTIAKADPMLTVSESVRKTYGDADFRLDAAQTGDGALRYSSSDEAVAAVDALGNVHIAGAGTAVITISAAETNNYLPGSKTVTVEVQRAAAEVTAEAIPEKTYADPEFAIRYTQSAPGTVNFVSADPSVAAVDENGRVRITGAGTTVITLSMAESENYTAAEAKVTLTVKPKPLTVTVIPGGGISGQTVTAAQARVEGLAQGEQVNVTLVYTKEGETSGSAAVPTQPGTYTVTASVSDPNYILESVAAAQFLLRQPVTVRIGDASKTYGEKDPSFRYEITGGSVIDGKPLVIRLERTAGENAGSYAITAPDAVRDNPSYAVTVVAGKLTVVPRDIGDAQVVLGPALTANGRKQTQTLESVTVTIQGRTVDVTCTVEGNAAAGAGGYTMTIRGTGNFTGALRQTFAIAPAAGQPVDTDSSGNPMLGTGKIAIRVETDAHAVQLDTSKVAVVEKLVQRGSLTSQELAQVAAGAELKIVLEITDGVGQTQQEQISNYTVKALGSQAQTGSLFDISLYKQLDGKTEWLYEIQEPIRLTIQVPETLVNTEKGVARTFWIVRCHNGNTEFLTTRYTGSSKTLSFETDRFGSFAIVYQDDKTLGNNQNTGTGDSPLTGDSSPIELCFTVMALSAAGICAVIAVERKKQKFTAQK